MNALTAAPFDKTFDALYYHPFKLMRLNAMDTVLSLESSQLYAHLDELLEQQYPLSDNGLSDMVSNDDIDYVELGKTGPYEYYHCNDDYDFYFLYQYTMPYFWTDMRYETVVFHDCVKQMEHPLYDPNHDLVVQEYRDNRIRGDDVSNYFTF